MWHVCLDSRSQAISTLCTGLPRKLSKGGRVRGSGERKSPVGSREKAPVGDMEDELIFSKR